MISRVSDIKDPADAPPPPRPGCLQLGFGCAWDHVPWKAEGLRLKQSIYCVLNLSLSRNTFNVYCLMHSSGKNQNRSLRRCWYWLLLWTTAGVGPWLPHFEAGLRRHGPADLYSERDAQVATGPHGQLRGVHAAAAAGVSVKCRDTQNVMMRQR